ncbi:valine--tRNA ligase [Candidatus Falkowbacteria bacterium]|uniref:Valine--tRNA ligase n=1 Tax=Candidatus Buchananbacteria bacterium CG10_big_fil_rev_8_21_14_0_10_33_19 TaxID=1974525 RepID=A0A2H0W5A8_9BACT|nr:valine--tRNA ligase [Candidatus Falkowbacteria bacterium]PIS06457.1 MAG: valine--tRNA ligase [Candidatus Buchananbacteria bacterium CG10_big_fil_rev_8_21_14_0_10_33_19]
MSRIELPKAYDASKTEDSIYKSWEESGFFNPDSLKNTKDYFSIAMPPPNATGVLHTGHATMLAIQDLMTRYNRMSGKKTLWLPGTDHASIATQTKVEKIMAKENLTRHQLGRDKFLERVDEFVEDSRNTIKNQVRKMGSSCDWSRERFTLDEGLNKAVVTAFEKMYTDGLIYRGDRVVNWCPRCHSTLADDEVEYKEQQAKMYTFKYHKDFPFTIATTRPETKLGDTAVAVNPKDERYKKYIGQEFDVDFVGVSLKLKIIADRNVDMEFGTGALGVTPAHSHVDYQMAIENKLPIVKVIDKDGNIEVGFGEFSGQSVIAAREAVVEKLKNQGLLEKEEDIKNNLSICYRCGTAIEPLPSLQWFVAVDKPFKLKDKSKLKWDKDEATLKELSIHVIKNNLIKIVPERFEKTYFHWMENLHDWCISRQIWYGHQIPVWYRDQEISVGQSQPASDSWTQDEDTLDTWFSSALWTFSTLGWPEETDDLHNFHPTSVMETGYDILFFWVARMIIMSVYCLNDIPFETVYLHGLVRDENGVKMSKSLDNAIDPLDMIEKYGTDALRLSMLIGVTPGNDFKLYDDKVESYRNFVNKLWNISRYVLTSVEEVKLVDQLPGAKTLADKWILSRLSQTIEGVNKNMASYNFSLAGESLQQFTRDEFADWYLEIAKVEKNKDEILLYILQNILKLWHPFIPFITEELWQNFTSDKLLMIEKWPEAEFKIDEKSITDIKRIQDLIVNIRNLRSENKVEPAKKVAVTVIVGENEILVNNESAVIKNLARCESLTVMASGEKPVNNVGTVTTDGLEIYLDLTGIIDTVAETERINKDIIETEKYIASLKAKLANEEFAANAPEVVVNGEKEKLKTAEEKLAKLQNQLNNLK